MRWQKFLGWHFIFWIQSCLCLFFFNTLYALWCSYKEETALYIKLGRISTSTIYTKHSWIHIRHIASLVIMCTREKNDASHHDYVLSLAFLVCHYTHLHTYLHSISCGHTREKCNDVLFISTVSVVFPTTFRGLAEDATWWRRFLLSISLPFRTETCARASSNEGCREAYVSIGCTTTAIIMSPVCHLYVGVDVYWSFLRWNWYNWRPRIVENKYHRKHRSKLWSLWILLSLSLFIHNFTDNPYLL